MTTPGPQELQSALQAIKDSLPGVPRDFLAQRAPGMQMFTVEQSMSLMERFARHANDSSRMPISTTVTSEADGSLTIRVTSAS